MKTTDEYLATLERMEPAITAVDTGPALASIAISLTRIATACEAQARLAGLTLQAHEEEAVAVQAQRIMQEAGLIPWEPQ